MDIQKLLDDLKIEDLEIRNKVELMINETSFESNKALLFYNIETIKSIYIEAKKGDIENKQDGLFFIEKIFLNLITLDKLLTEGTSTINENLVYDFNSICTISRNVIDTIAQFDAIFTKSKNIDEQNFNLLLFKYSYWAQRFYMLDDKFNAINAIEAEKRRDALDKEIREHRLYKRNMKHQEKTHYFNFLEHGKFNSLSLSKLIDNLIGDYGIYQGYKPKLYKFLSSESHTTIGVLDYFKYFPTNDKIEVRLNHVIDITLQYIKCLLVSMSKYYNINENTHFELLKIIYRNRKEIKNKPA